MVDKKRPKEAANSFESIIKASVKETKVNTPYEKYRDSKFWKLVDKELKTLEKNSDIILQTNRDYITGAIVKTIIENG